MRTSTYLLAALAVAGFATASAQNTGNPASSRQPSASPPTATPMPSQRTAPTPARPVPPSSQATTPMPSQQQAIPNSTTQPMPQQTQPMEPALPAPTSPSSTAQQTVFPPDSRIDPNNPANNPANTQQQQQQGVQQQQQRIPPASRGVGTSGRPDCSKLRGLEKSECERRDTTRDDLPAGVTPKQPEK